MKKALNTVDNIPTMAQPAGQAEALPWRVAGTAVRGISHQRFDVACQDAQGSRVLENGMLLVALADGAGSAQYSDLGAQHAVQASLDFMTAALAEGSPQDWEGFFCETFGAAREAVLRLADGSTPGGEAAPLPARAYACTLCCVVVTADRLIAGQVGDGAVVAGELDREAPLFTVTRLQRGEYANETHFLVQEDALEQLIIDVVERTIARVAVMSDGLIRLALKMPSQDPYEPFFAPLFRFAETITEEGDAEEQLSRFLNSDRVNARTDDDKSLVLAVRGVPTDEGQRRDVQEPAGANGSEDQVDR